MILVAVYLQIEGLLATSLDSSGSDRSVAISGDPRILVMGVLKKEMRAQVRRKFLLSRPLRYHASLAIQTRLLF